jgi:hypothetical protein
MKCKLAEEKKMCSVVSVYCLRGVHLTNRNVTARKKTIKVRKYSLLHYARLQAAIACKTDFLIQNLLLTLFYSFARD